MYTNEVVKRHLWHCQRASFAVPKHVLESDGCDLMLNHRAQVGVDSAYSLYEIVASLHALLVLYLERHYDGAEHTIAVLKLDAATPRSHISHEHV